MGVPPKTLFNRTFQNTTDSISLNIYKNSKSVESEIDLIPVFKNNERDRGEGHGIAVSLQAIHLHRELKNIV
jgi:hypothetical protein